MIKAIRFSQSWYTNIGGKPSITLAKRLRQGHFSPNLIFFKKVVGLSIFKYYVLPKISTKLFIIALAVYLIKAVMDPLRVFSTNYYNKYSKLGKMF